MENWGLYSEFSRQIHWRFLRHFLSTHNKVKFSFLSACSKPKLVYVKKLFMVKKSSCN